LGILLQTCFYQGNTVKVLCGRAVCGAVPFSENIISENDIRNSWTVENEFRNMVSGAENYYSKILFSVPLIGWSLSRCSQYVYSIIHKVQ